MQTQRVNHAATWWSCGSKTSSLYMLTTTHGLAMQSTSFLVQHMRSSISAILVSASLLLLRFSTSYLGGLQIIFFSENDGDGGSNHRSIQAAAESKLGQMGSRVRGQREVGSVNHDIA